MTIQVLEHHGRRQVSGQGTQAQMPVDGSDKIHMGDSICGRRKVRAGRGKQVRNTTMPMTLIQTLLSQPTYRYLQEWIRP